MYCCRVQTEIAHDLCLSTCGYCMVSLSTHTHKHKRTYQIQLSHRASMAKRSLAFNGLHFLASVELMLLRCLSCLWFIIWQPSPSSVKGSFIRFVMGRQKICGASGEEKPEHDFAGIRTLTDQMAITDFASISILLKKRKN